MLPSECHDLLDALVVDTPHTGGTLRSHLEGTHLLLRSWGAADVVCLAGLFHSVYGTQWLDRAADADARARVASAIGADAEQLTYLFSVVERNSLWADAPRTRNGDEVDVDATAKQSLMLLDLANFVEPLCRVRLPDEVLARYIGRLTTYQHRFPAHVYADAMHAAVTALTGPSDRTRMATVPSLEDLLAPMSIAEFVETYWARRPVHIRGPARKFRHLFSRERLDRLLARGGVTIHATPDRGRTQLPISAQHAAGIFAQGATLCISGAHLVDAQLAAFVDRIRHELGFVGIADIRAYLSPPGTGYAMHTDARIATTLQIEGQKRWRYSTTPALAWPHYQMRPAGDDGFATSHRFRTPIEIWEFHKLPSELTFEEVVLEPGDVLCLPAGTWHAAEAVGTTPSLAMNLAFEPMPFWSLLGSALEPGLQRRAEWRGAPPPSPETTVRPSARVQSYFVERIDELIAELEACKRDPSVLDEAWRRAWIGTSANAQTLPLASIGDIAPDDELAVATRFTIGVAGSALRLYASRPPQELLFPTETRPFFERLLTTGTFTARAAVRWTSDGEDYAWTDVANLLAILVSNHILERRPRA